MPSANKKTQNETFRAREGRKLPATIRDIRERTGLSLATISKYLNGGNVLPENREKIEEAIKALDYQINEMARGLVTNKTRTVGVSVHDIGSIFCGVLLRYIGDVLKENGYSMIICDARDDEATEADNIKFFLSKKVDGIIVIPKSKKAGFLKSALNAKIPVVLLDRTIRGSNCDCVRIDNRAAAASAVNTLCDYGHSKIGIIYSEQDYTGIERYKGYREAMEDIGIEINENYIYPGQHSIEHGYESMRRLLKQKDKPTAVLTTNYEVTLGTVMAVNESNYICPDDISILGFDNLILAHVLNPQVTLVVQPMKEMGETAARLVLKHIAGSEKTASVEYILGTKIEHGNSIKRLK